MEKTDINRQSKLAKMNSPDGITLSSCGVKHRIQSMDGKISSYSMLCLCFKHSFFFSSKWLIKV
ncbi:hypothetical protein T01_10693 [Trichinella spiralis]|uniref:Uncharacterized protein n=1 Tax=Trichinella spiralis TaxID=6334 RepID=A0A0V1APR4_TRISP|nr:hypothetical protein T01_10693 [Trichinella spiralis]